MKAARKQGSKAQPAARGRVQRAAESLALVLLPVVLGLALVVSDGAPVDRLRNLLFDQYQRWQPRAWSPDLPVRVVDIDDESLAKFGQWPWPRERLAELTNKLAGAGAVAIVYDILFSEPDRLAPATILAQLPDLPERDALAAAMAAKHMTGGDALAQAFARAPVVTAMALTNEPDAARADMKTSFVQLGDDPAPALPHFNGMILPQPDLLAAAQGIGAINYLPDRDLIVRKVPLAFAVGSGADAVIVPSLAAEALRVAQQADSPILKATNASGELSFGARTAIVSAKIGDAVIPTEADGSVRVRFAGTQAGRHIAAWKVIDGTADPAEINGRIMLIGSSAAALADLRSTPLEAAVPGVDVHAELLEHIASGSLLARPDYALGVEVLALVVGGILIAWLARLLRPLPAAFAALFLIALAAAASWLAFLKADLLFDPLMPSATILASYGVATIAVYRRSERERRSVREAFSRYLAPAIVARLAADPSRLALGGEARDVTVLFFDVRDFTGRSERLSAEGTVAFLNSLHTPLTAAVMKEGGTIDKYLGDGLMAFWNAPLDVPDHASAACRAALAMLATIPAIDRGLAEAAAASGREHEALAVGIGINSGDVFVGNMGSQQRFDYSIVGDAVNVTARLEALTKEFGVPILVSQATAEQAKGFHFVDLGTTGLRGRKGFTRIFALHGAAGSDAGFDEFAKLHAAVLAAADAKDENLVLLAAEAHAHPEGGVYEGFYRRLIEGFEA